MTISKSEGQSDLTTLRALILGDGETPIDSFDAAERVKRWLDEHGWGKSTAYPPCQCNTPSDWWLHINALVAKRLPVLAWEQGRDAAAEAAMNDVCTGLPEAKLAHAVQYGVWHDKIDPLQAYIPIEAALAWGQRIMEAIRALTPPADLASGERRAPVSPRHVTDEMVKRAAKAAWDEWHSQNDHQDQGWLAWEKAHPVQAMEWEEVVRAALTAALNDGETNG